MPLLDQEAISRVVSTVSVCGYLCRRDSQAEITREKLMPFARFVVRFAIILVCLLHYVCPDCTNLENGFKPFGSDVGILCK